MFVRPLLFAAVLSVMSQGNSLEQPLNKTSNGNEISTARTGNSTEQLADLICNPFCNISTHPVPDDVQIKILNDDEKMKRFFNRDAFKDLDLYRSQAPRDPEYVPLCEPIIRQEQPTAARDIHGVKHFLLNPRKGEYVQMVEVELCKHEGLPCSEINDHVSPGVATRCETQFFRKGMVAVNPESLEPYEIAVRVSSGCNCFIQKTMLART